MTPWALVFTTWVLTATTPPVPAEVESVILSRHTTFLECNAELKKTRLNVPSYRNYRLDCMYQEKK